MATKRQKHSDLRYIVTMVGVLIGGALGSLTFLTWIAFTYEGGLEGPAVAILGGPLSICTGLIGLFSGITIGRHHGGKGEDEGDTIVEANPSMVRSKRVTPPKEPTA